MSTQCPYGPSHMWRVPGNAPGYWGVHPMHAVPYQNSVIGICPYGSQNAPPWGDVSGQPQSGPPHTQSHLMVAVPQYVLMGEKSW